MPKETVLVHLIQLNQIFRLNLGFYNWWLPSCVCFVAFVQLLSHVCSPVDYNTPGFSVLHYLMPLQWFAGAVSYQLVRGNCMQLFLIPHFIFTLWESRKHGGGCFFSFFPGETFVKHYQQIITSSFKEPVFVKSQLTVSTWSFAMQLILKAGIRSHPDLNIQKKYSAKKKVCFYL